jgi:hypothetical protein
MSAKAVLLAGKCPEKAILVKLRSERESEGKIQDML